MIQKSICANIQDTLVSDRHFYRRPFLQWSVAFVADAILFVVVVDELHFLGRTQLADNLEKRKVWASLKIEDSLI